MADINVSLGLDDSKFKQGIANSQTAAQKLGNSLNSAFGGGVNGINKLGQGIDALNVKFQNLGRAIVGVGLSAFVVQALRSADALSDLSAALGVNTARLMEMELAAGGAGGNLDSLSGMLGRLEDNLQGAIDGNQKMRDSLAAVGLGYNEITQLNPDQVFNRIAKALAGMTDSNKRAALATELLGKQARLMDWNSYIGTIENVNGTMDEQAKAVEAAGKMMDEFAKTAQLVGAEFLKLIGPIVEFLTPLDNSANQMEKAQFAAKGLAVALGLFAASSVINALKSIAGAFVTMTGALFGSVGATSAETLAMGANTGALMMNARARAAGAAARVASLEASLATARAEAVLGTSTLATDAAQKAATRATWLLVSARAALAGDTALAAAAEAGLTAATNANTVANTANAASGAGILGFLGKYAKALSVAAVAIGALTFSSDLNEGEDEWAEKNRKAGELLKKRKDALAGLSEAEKARYNALSQDQKNAIIDSIVAQQEMKKQQTLIDSVYGKTRPSGGGFKETEEERKNRIALAAAVDKQKQSIENLRQSLKAKNEDQLEELNQARENLTLSERERSIKKEVLEFESRYKNEINNLRQRERELISQSTSEDSQARKEALAQLPLVQAELKRLTESRDQERQAIEATAAATYDAANAEKTRQTIAQFSAEQRIQAEQKVRDLQDEMAKMTMTELEQKYYDIEAAARNAALAKIDSINAENQANGRALLTEEQKLEIMKAATQESGKIRDLTRKNYEASRSFSTGWKRALNEYVSNATNAAKRAENIFRTMTQGMEEAIVNFAKTGKFEWKNFVAMMLEELLRAQIQQVFAQLMGTMSGTMRGAQQTMLGGSMGGSQGGGLFSGLGSVLGGLFGSGSVNPSTNPMVIGGGIGGGGIGDTFGNMIGGITGSLGGIVSGIGSGISDVFSGAGSFVSDVVDGIGDFFGGFFANGGHLPAGKWGIAGEAGPELISGPANITPMGMGGSTSVTYNINAVDAASFQALVARDPSFIYAVTEQGRRSVNGTRR